MAIGVATPFAVRQYKNIQLQNTEKAAVDRVREFSLLQKSYFEKKGEYAQTFKELGGDWSAVEDMDAPKPSNLNGYRFRILKSQGESAKGGSASFVDVKGRMTGGVGLLAAPTQYGYTANHTFILGDGQIYVTDFGPHTNPLTMNLNEFVIPPKSGKVE